MLDGDYTDNFNMLIFDTYLEMNNNANGTNNVSYSSQEVHKYTFETWGLKSKYHCKMNVNLSIKDTKKVESSPYSVHQKDTMLLTQAATNST